MEEERLKVLFVSSWYPSRVNPLLGIFVQRHAVAVAHLCDVSAIYVCADEQENIEEGVEDGVYTIRVYYKKTESRIPVYSQYRKWRQYISAWKKALSIYEAKKGRPDIINSNVVFPVTAIAIKLKAKWKMPYVITEHWTGYFPEDGRYKGARMQKIWKSAVSKASAVITVSAALKNQMIKVGLNNTYYVIPNIVDIETFNISTKPAREQIRFIHTSSPDNDRKNIGGIIRAFKIFTEMQSNASLTLVVGNGPEVEKLKQLATSLGLKDSVQFVDWKPKNELAELMHNSTAFILFSSIETQGVVLLEAMCCGIPVISSRCGGPEEYINAKNGLLVDVGNEKQLAEAMQQIVKNGTDYNAAEIRNSVINMVSEESVATKFVQVYKKVLNLN